MIVGKIGAEIGCMTGAGRHGGHPTLHGNVGTFAMQASQGNGAVMAAQAEFRSPGGLSNAGSHGGAAVNHITGIRHGVIP